MNKNIVPLNTKQEESPNRLSFTLEEMLEEFDNGAIPRSQMWRELITALYDTANHVVTGVTAVADVRPDNMGNIPIRAEHLYSTYAEDVFGRSLFYGDACKVQHRHGAYYEVLAGTAYVAGIRFFYPGMENLLIEYDNLPISVWVDVSWPSDPMDKREPIVLIVVTDEKKADYIDNSGVKHTLILISYIHYQGNVLDCRNSFNSISNAGFTHVDINSAIKDNNSRREYIKIASNNGAIYKRENTRKTGSITDIHGNIFNKETKCPPNISLSKALLNYELVVNLPLRFQDYDTVIEKYGYSYLFPQCAVAFEDVIYICYLSSGVDSRPPWVAKYKFTTSEYLGCFSAGDWISEGIEVLRKNGILTLFIRGTENSIQEFNIENVSNMEILTDCIHHDVNMHSMFFHKEGKIYIQARQSVGYTTSRDTFHIYDLNFKFQGIIYLDKYSTSLTGGLYADNFHKLQAFTYWNDYIIAGFGGTYSQSGGTPTSRQMQGVKAFSSSGNLIAEALWNPETAMESFRKAGIRTTIMEQEGVFSYENRLFSVMITHSHSNTEYGYNEGIAILELNNGDTLNLEEHKAPFVPNPRNTEYVMQCSFDSRLLNPITGENMSTIEDIINYMRNSGQTNYDFYSSGLNPSITDFNGESVPSGYFVKLYGVNGYTYRMEWYGATTIRSFWIIPSNESQVETRESYRGGIWSFCASDGEEFVRFSGAKNVYLTGAVLETTKIRPEDDSVYSLGEPGKQWDNVYVKNSYIQYTDDAVILLDDIPEKWIKAAKKINPIRYKKLDNGNSNDVRWHIGYSAKAVFECLKNEEIENPWEISFLCKDALTKELEDGSVIPLIDEKTGNQKEKWGLRISELNTLIIHSKLE